MISLGVSGREISPQKTHTLTPVTGLGTPPSQPLPYHQTTSDASPALTPTPTPTLTSHAPLSCPILAARSRTYQGQGISTSVKASPPA